MNSIKFLVCCFCLLLSLTGCSNTPSIPDEKTAEQATVTYMAEKYGVDINIRNSTIFRKGVNRYMRVAFDLVGITTINGYDAYVSFDSTDHTTPEVVSENYMKVTLEPIMVDYLNNLICVDVANISNLSQQTVDPIGFYSDFPLIHSSDETKQLIQSTQLMFDYWIYTCDKTSDLEESILDQIQLFSDDLVRFHLIKCDSTKFDELHQKYKNNEKIDLSLLNGNYQETIIKTY
ncbi:MAG: hypothetical protein K2O42_00005 [Oscillospiraceae bacterium]|nr:hypothetical protein [Oscillospiraceae bacterium]